MDNSTFLYWYIRIFIVILLLSITSSLESVQDKEDCTQTLSHSDIIQQIQNFPEDKEKRRTSVNNLIKDITRLKVNYKINVEQAEEIGALVGFSSRLVAEIK